MSLRRRLIVALVGSVALTAIVAGAAATVLAERSLRNALIDDAVDGTAFNLTVLAPALGVGEDLTADSVIPRAAANDLVDRFLTRGPEGVRAEFVDASVATGGASIPADVISDSLRAIVDAGEVAYEFVDIEGTVVLLTGGRLAGTGPPVFFLHSAAVIANSRTSLILTAVGVAVVGASLGSLAAIRISQRVLTPVTAASHAASRLADGDLTARLSTTQTDELGRLGESFNEMASALSATIDDLEEARRREQQFVADVSHELKTPLTGLVNAAALLRSRLAVDPAASEDQRRLVAIVDDDSARLRRLVDDLLEISRADLSDPPRRDRIDLTAFLDDLVEQRSPGAAVSVEGYDLESDRRSLERIVGNLLDNARLHGGDDTVTVQATATDDDTIISVSDRGPGVDAGDIPSLTAPFTTLNEARSTGSGLGLAIVAKHVSRIGGHLTISNRPEGGLTVEVRIPNSVARSLPDGESIETLASEADVTDDQGDRT